MSEDSEGQGRGQTQEAVPVPAKYAGINNIGISIQTIASCRFSPRKNATRAIFTRISRPINIYSAGFHEMNHGRHNAAGPLTGPSAGCTSFAGGFYRDSSPIGCGDSICTRAESYSTIYKMHYYE
ncbi:MAG: hypothetical protein A2176_12940 [Spirochaetes bacterium RBG_13_51_14]|nr:MAG: hypothetical protein A2176_12940 [Spirochaetes bacterium RBG_13_51_14]